MSKCEFLGEVIGDNLIFERDASFFDSENSSVNQVNNYLSNLGIKNAYVLNITRDKCLVKKFLIEGCKGVNKNLTVSDIHKIYNYCFNKYFLFEKSEYNIIDCNGSERTTFSLLDNKFIYVCEYKTKSVTSGKIKNKLPRSFVSKKYDKILEDLDIFKTDYFCIRTGAIIHYHNAFVKVNLYTREKVSEFQCLEVISSYYQVYLNTKVTFYRNENINF